MSYVCSSICKDSASLNSSSKSKLTNMKTNNRLVYDLDIVKSVKFVQLAGGLGNQLFIWSMAHKLAQSKKSQIVLLANYSKNFDRECEIKELSKSCVHGIKILILPEKLNIFKFYDFLLANVKYKRVKNVLNKYFYSSEHPMEVPEENQLGNKIFLRGFFQSSRMVDEIRHCIVSEVFDFAANLFSRESFINLHQTIHVRRGDLKYNSETIGMLTDEYFLEQLEEGPYTMVTDETKKGTSKLWQLSELVYLGSTSPWLVIWLGINSEIFVGSNSTLSWWAVYLNERDGAKLYLPKSWTKRSEERHSSLHLGKVRYVESKFY
jgi:hypothetical protein